MAVTIFSYHFDVGSSGTKSLCMGFSGLVTSSLEFCKGRRVSLFSTFDCLTHCSHDMTHFLFRCTTFR